MTLNLQADKDAQAVLVPKTALGTLVRYCFL